MPMILPLRHQPIAPTLRCAEWATAETTPSRSLNRGLVYRWRARLADHPRSEPFVVEYGPGPWLEDFPCDERRLLEGMRVGTEAYIYGTVALSTGLGKPHVVHCETFTFP